MDGAKGSFSYQNESINGFQWAANLQVRVEAINLNIAKVYLTDDNANPLPIMDGGNIRLQTADGVEVAPYNNEFLIVWVDSYVLLVDGTEKLWITKQKQQAFKSAADVTHFMVAA